MTKTNKAMFDKALQAYTRKHFGTTPMYDIFLKTERNKLSQQNTTIIPFIERYHITRGSQKLTVLDYGCGTGGGVVAWSLKGAKSYGTELSEEDLSLARLRATVEGVTPTYVTVTSEKTPFKGKQFDIVVCDQVLEHIDNFEGALKEMRRVLKRGATLYIDIPNKYYPLEPHYQLLFIHWLPRRFKGAYLQFRKRRELGYYTSSLSHFTLRQALQKSGFTIVASSKEYIKHILKPESIRNKIAKLLIALGVPFYLFSPTIQFIAQRKTP